MAPPKGDPRKLAAAVEGFVVRSQPVVGRSVHVLSRLYREAEANVSEMDGEAAARR